MVNIAASFPKLLVFFMSSICAAFSGAYGCDVHFHNLETETDDVLRDRLSVTFIEEPIVASDSTSTMLVAASTSTELSLQTQIPTATVAKGELVGSN